MHFFFLVSGPLHWCSNRFAPPSEHFYSAIPRLFAHTCSIKGHGTLLHPNGPFLIAKSQILNNLKKVRDRSISRQVLNRSSFTYRHGVGDSSSGKIVVQTSDTVAKSTSTDPTNFTSSGPEGYGCYCFSSSVGKVPSSAGREILADVGASSCSTSQPEVFFISQNVTAFAVVAYHSKPPEGDSAFPTASHNHYNRYQSFRMVGLDGSSDQGVMVASSEHEALKLEGVRSCQTCFEGCLSTDFRQVGSGEERIQPPKFISNFGGTRLPSLAKISVGRKPSIISCVNPHCRVTKHSGRLNEQEHSLVNSLLSALSDPPNCQKVGFVSRRSFLQPIRTLW